MKSADDLPPSLSDEERAHYEWQMWVPGFGEEGQRRLKGASVLISRVGGVGGLVAHQLAAAGVGKLILAHAGNVKPSDLHRQLLMRHAAVGASRIECAVNTLRDSNPFVEIVGVPENVSSTNVERLVDQADVVVSCAPLFEERFALNAEAVKQRKPFIDCAMFELTGQVFTTLPGSACLACRTPEKPPDWRRQFPVFGAVSGTVACVGAMEAIKVIAQVGEPLVDRLLIFDLREMRFRVFRTKRNPACRVCVKS